MFQVSAKNKDSGEAEDLLGTQVAPGQQELYQRIRSSTEFKYTYYLSWKRHLGLPGRRNRSRSHDTLNQSRTLGTRKIPPWILYTPMQ